MLPGIMPNLGAAGGSTVIKYVGGVVSGSAVNNNATVAFHPDAAAGDLAIIWVNIDDARSGKHVTPPTYTRVNPTQGTHGNMYAKALNNADLITPPYMFALANDENAWCTMVYTGIDFSGLTANGVEEDQNNEFSGITNLINAGVASAPVILVHGGGCKNNYSNFSPTGNFSGQDADEVLQDGGKGRGEANGFLTALAVNSSPFDVWTNSWTPGHTNNSQVTGYLTF